MLETFITVLLWVLAIAGGIFISPFVLILSVVIVLAFFVAILAVLFFMFFVGAVMVKLVLLPFEKIREYRRARKRLYQ